jgi:uncharacterized protein (UPF0333 family)
MLKMTGYCFWMVMKNHAEIKKEIIENCRKSDKDAYYFYRIFSRQEKINFSGTQNDKNFACSENQKHIIPKKKCMKL